MARALTLSQALERAAEVDPEAIIASLEWTRERSETAELVANLGVTPTLSYTPFFAPAVESTPTFSLSVAILSPPSWFEALAQSATARGAGARSRANAVDARFAVAALWYQVFAAEEAERLAQAGLSEARATAQAAEARLRAGLTSELDAKASRLGVLNAQATLASAQSNLYVARARLESALQTSVDAAEASPLPSLPESVGTSAWMAVYAQNVSVARWTEAASVADLLPEVVVYASRPLGDGTWTVYAAGTWSFSGLVSPVLDVQQAVIARRIALAQFDAYGRTEDLARRIARAQVDAARARKSAALDGERLAGETVAVGRARLGAGLISTLDLLQLQAQEASARVARVSAELDLALAILDSRRLAGLEPL